jgi:signal transduction histidine kinase
MFYRASDLSKGSGLGLYIAKESIGKIGGTISVQSVYGKGTIFEIVIPNSKLS